jgi:hypothetical protein
VVPSSAGKPCARGGFFRSFLNALLHVFEGGAAGEVYRQLDLPGGAKVRVRVIKAGHHEGSMQIDELGRGRLKLRLDGCSVSNAENDAASDSESGDSLRMRLCKIDSGQNIAVEIDRFGLRCGLSR